MFLKNLLAASSLALSMLVGTAHASDAANLLGVSAREQGSVIVARGWEAGQLVSQLGVEGQGVNEAVIVTGETARYVSHALTRMGAHVIETTYGVAETRVLILTNEAAIEFHQVLIYVYGRHSVARRGVTVLHGGMHHLIDCLDGILRGTLNLGLNMARFTVHAVACSAFVAINFAESVIAVATHLIVKAANGAVMVVACAAGTMLMVVQKVGHGTLHVAHSAVVGVFRLTRGVWLAVTNWLRELFTCPIQCHSVVVYL